MRFTREQLQLLSDVLWAHQDEGPRGAGWASDPVSKLRAAVDVALAEPEPEGPTLAELDDLCEEHCFNCEDRESLECLLSVITDALARWGRPAPQPLPVLPEGTQVIEPTEHTLLVPVAQPIPVSERLPGPEDCDAEGRCWAWNPDPPDDDEENSWVLQPLGWVTSPWTTHWLPAHALPLPCSEND